MSTQEIIGLILIGGTVGFAIYGAWRGFIPQLGSVAAFLIGFMGAKLFAPAVASALNLPSMLCYVVVFALVFFLVIMLTRLLHFTVKMLLLGPVDRILGALIGAAKWLLATSILINLFIMCAPETTLFSSRPAVWTTQFAPRLFGLAQTYMN